MTEEKKEKKHTHKEDAHKKPHEKDLKELEDKYYRTLADLDNFKKRAAVERDEIMTFANTALIAALLPIMDSFDRALPILDHPRGSEEMAKGVALIKKQFDDVLEKAGVTMIDALGKQFDPHVHEAILKKPSDSDEEGSVIEVAQKGYKLHGRVIRPAMVIISERKV
jgi:molecular chaperone GrpE